MNNPANRISYQHKQDFNVQSKQAIRIALLGFGTGQERKQLEALFAHAQRWQQPWEVVSDSRYAQFLLIADDDPETFLSQNSEISHFNRHQLIVYSYLPSGQADWHLRKFGGNQAPSPLEFTILLKEVSKAYANSLANTEIISAKQLLVRKCNGQLIPDTFLSSLLIEFPLKFQRGLTA